MSPLGLPALTPNAVLHTWRGPTALRALGRRRGPLERRMQGTEMQNRNATTTALTTDCRQVQTAPL